MVKRLSSKQIYFYIISILTLFFTSVFLILFANKKFEFLYSKEHIETYYSLIYLFTAAVGYYLDSQSRKEPFYLTLFLLPILSLAFLLICALVGNINLFPIIAIIILFLLILILGYLFYKHLVTKIMIKKHGYQTCLFFYVLLHLTLVLAASFLLIN